MSTNTTTNPPKESYMDIISTPRPTRRLSAASIRAERANMDEKIASFETLAGISGRVRAVLDWTDAESDMEFQRARRAARADFTDSEPCGAARPPPYFDQWGRQLGART